MTLERESVITTRPQPQCHHDRKLNRQRGIKWKGKRIREKKIQKEKKRNRKEI